MQERLAWARRRSSFAKRRQGEARVWWGACDGLFTPRPLGPLLDIADQAGGRLAAALAGADPRDQAAAALLAELRGPRPTVVVLKDAHWADEASLDVLRFLARRLGATRGLLLVTYRDDEVGPAHPLRVSLGEIAAFATVHRLALPPLTADAVRALAAGTSVDPERLFRQTAGNPFFVTEVLAAGFKSSPILAADRNA